MEAAQTADSIRSIYGGANWEVLSATITQEGWAP
jgi:hypothetical protein